MNRRQFEEVKRWGETLRQEEREDLRAAGEAIRLLCVEIERIGGELSAARAAAAAAEAESEPGAEDTLSGEHEAIESSLRGRLQRRLAGLHR